jgi:hypothetical protein
MIAMFDNLLLVAGVFVVGGLLPAAMRTIKARRLA